MYDIKDANQFIAETVVKHPLFDSYRIVNTDTYQVHRWEDGTAVPQNDSCYHVWNRTEPCINCISKRAVKEGRQFTKIEVLGDKVFLIEAVGLPELGPGLALELIRDVTDSILINDVGHKKNKGLTGIIQKMYDLANRDSYTGLYNKRFVEYELQRELLKRKKTDPLEIVLFDIDSFKQINDTYGHLMGDHVLLTIADILRSFVVRHSGWAGRVGGDEFILVFQGKDRVEVVKLVEELKAEVHAVDFKLVDQSCRITISVGMAGADSETRDWKKLFSIADQAMYENKQRR